MKASSMLNIQIPSILKGSSTTLVSAVEDNELVRIKVVNFEIITTKIV